MVGKGHSDRWWAPGGEPPVRDEVVSSVRRQLEAGSYHPPVEDLVDRLVDAIIARHGPSPEDRGQ